MPHAPAGGKPPAGGTPVAAPAAGASGAPAATPGHPPIDQLQGRPIGRVLTKMGKVTREQVVEALTFQKSKGGALGRSLIDLGYIKEADLSTYVGEVQAELDRRESNWWEKQLGDRPAALSG